MKVALRTTRKLNVDASPAQQNATASDTVRMMYQSVWTPGHGSLGTRQLPKQGGSSTKQTGL